MLAALAAAAGRYRPGGVPARGAARAWAGILLSILFGVRLRLLPPNGYVDLRDDPAGGRATWIRLYYSRWASIRGRGADPLRALGVLSRCCTRTTTAPPARWAGREGSPSRGTALRNAALSSITVLGLQLASVIVGAIVIEQVLNLPGLGSLLVRRCREGRHGDPGHRAAAGARA